jgi:peptide chain release factor subunit 1
MITEEQIAQIEGFDGAGEQVLSVYLDLDPARQVRRVYRTVFEDLVKELRERTDGPVRDALSREAAAVQAWLEQEAPHGKGLAIFSCAPRRFWQAHFLPVRVEDHVVFEPRPDLGPLQTLADEHERYAIALVDKQGARLFTVFMGEIEETETFKDFVPGKHDQGGWSQARYQRHHEAHVYWHLKRVTHHLAELFRRRTFDRLILAGAEEATSELRRVLPRALASRLVAVVPGQLFARTGEILEKTLEIERRVEREVEERLVAELLEMAGAGGRATCGVVPTLDALWLGQVQTLVVAHGTHAAGSECPNCGRLEPASVTTCAACGLPVRPVQDVFHRAMGRAREEAGRVEVVHDDAARRLREAGDGLGALLRYR